MRLRAGAFRSPFPQNFSIFTVALAGVGVQILTARVKNLQRECVLRRCLDLRAERGPH